MAAIDQLFDQLLERDGSDLHLSIGYPPMIRLRGLLEPLRERPLDEREVSGLIMELLDSQRQRDFEDRHDLDFAYAYGTKARFRANYMMKTTGPGAVFRTIPSRVPSAEDLKLPEAIIKLADRRAGLIPGHRSHGQRQEHDAGRSDLAHQPQPARARAHDRGPGRVRARAGDVPGHPP